MNTSSNIRGGNVHIDNFINDKISQMIYYLNALLQKSIHPIEVNNFIWDCFEEWTLFNVTDDTPSNARERVFWHLIHEIKLGSINDLDNDLALAAEIETCLDFLNGHGNYPINCIGWRPVD